MNRRSLSKSYRFVLSMALGASLFASTSHAAPPDVKTTRLWKAKCASCHGEDGKGGTEQGKKQGVRDLSTAAWQKEFSDEQLKKATAEGVKREKGGKKQEMEPFKDQLKPEQIDALVGYMRGLAK